MDLERLRRERHHHPQSNWREGTRPDGTPCYLATVFQRSSRGIKHWRVFSKWGVPVVSMKELNSGYRKLTPSQYMTGAAAFAAARRYIAVDGSHPNAAAHVVLARIVLHALMQAHRRLASIGCSNGGLDAELPRGSGLSYASCHFADTLQELEHRFLGPATSGWRYTVERQRTPTQGPPAKGKPGFVSEAMGSAMLIGIRVPPAALRHSSRIPADPMGLRSAVRARSGVASAAAVSGVSCQAALRTATRAAAHSEANSHASSAGAMAATARDSAVTGIVNQGAQDDSRDEISDPGDQITESAVSRDRILTPAMLLHLGYLQSYEHMGSARVSCVSGCACDQLLIDG